MRIARWFLAIATVTMFLPESLAAQLTTATVRGRVTGTDGQPLEAAQVSATNQESGITVVNVTTADGRYLLFGVPVGPYTVQVRRIGYRAIERRDIRLRLGETLTLDFQLESAPTTLTDVTVVEQANPLIDRGQSGRVDQISAEQIEAIPTNGRNFADLVALSPSVGVNVGDGSGGNLSIGGGRRGANVIQIDGAGSTGTFFGGEARGSDRVPFAFSIETVKEFQVVTNAYDVEYGFFAGGLINAVTKGGTNELNGSVYGFFRNDALTGEDFFGNEATEFKSQQFGGTLSGPIVRDRLHFYLSVERQDRDEPVFGLPAPGSTPDPSTGVHPDSVKRFLDILANTYGVNDQAGRFLQTQDETAIFGRLDWQISNQHRLTLRHNFTDLAQENDRISANELAGNGGVFENVGNSTVVQLTSVLGPALSNEFRAQYATEPRPRKAYSLLPQARVDITSDFGASQGRTTAECCNDPVLPNNLEETTVELTNNLHYRTGPHTFKFGAQLNNFSYENFFFFNQQGTYRFRSLSDFEAKAPSEYTRALPNPGPDGQFFTSDDIAPLAVYDVRELAVYAQDSWEISDRLMLSLGARVDRTTFPDKAPFNQTAQTDLGVRTDVAPSQTNFSPRFGFTYAMDEMSDRLLRGGIGVFYGRFPAVLYSNSLLNTGSNQLSLRCTGLTIPSPDYQSFDPNDPGSIPASCTVGGPSAPVATINAFSPDFEYPRSLKSNLGFEQAIGARFKIGVDAVYSKTSNNFYVVDRNILTQPQFTSAVENRPVFADASDISSSGRVSTGANRISGNFADVLEHVSPSEGRQYQLTFRLEQRPTERYSWQASYSYSNSMDNASYSCCISSTAVFETPTAGDHRFLGEPGDELKGTWGPSDFDRRHTVVLSGSARLPLGIELSGIFRMSSGSPWTPVVDGDVNGDARFDNDRAYIGTEIAFDTPEDQALMQEHLANFECLREQEGRIATRNSCRNPWVRLLDLRVRRAFPTIRGQELELVADFFNVLNVINSDWGRVVGVSQFGGDRELLVLEGFDETTREFTYSVNPSFGRESDLTPFRTDQFQMQLGARYRF